MRSPKWLAFDQTVAQPEAHSKYLAMVVNRSLNRCETDCESHGLPDYL